MTNFFLFLYRFFQKHRLIFFIVFFAHLILFGYFAAKIHPQEDIAAILPKEKQTEKLNDILRNAKFADRLVLMLSLRDSTRREPDSLIAYATALRENLLTHYAGYIRQVNDQVNDSLFPALLNIVDTHMPLYLEASDYQALDRLLQPDSMAAALDRDKRLLSSPAGMVMKSFIVRDPLNMGAPALKKLRKLQYDDNFELYNNHIVTKDGRYMLLFISPAFPPDNTAANGRLLRGLDETIDRLEKNKYPGVEASYFGSVAVSAGNAVQLRRDSILTLSITVIFLIVFIGGYFRKKRAPLLILIPVVSGALFSLAMIYWIKGSISVIALAAGSVVLGIAINYSLHVFNHFRHTRDLRQVISDLSFPLTIGSFTTIGGFFCLEFVRSEILKDLGWFAAFSLIGAAFSSLVFLPQLIGKGSHSGDAGSGNRNSWIEKLARYQPERNKYIVGSIALLTIVFAFTAGRVHFDADMMHMNYMPDNLRRSEATLNRINAVSLRSVYLVTDGKNLEQSLERNEKLQPLLQSLEDSQIIKKSSGAFSLFLSDSLQQERILRWNQYWTPAKKNHVRQLLKEAGAKAGFTPGAFDGFNAWLDTKMQPLNLGEKEVLQNAFAGDYMISKPGQVSVVTLLRVSPEDRTKVYNHFSSVPAVTVVDRQYLAGKLVSIINLDFSQIAWMTSLLVFGVMLITYGRIELTLVSFIPMGIAFIWILGIMGLFGLEFNIVNIILSALIFGLGDDYSLFIMDGLLQEYKTGKQNLSSYKSSIVLSAITTLAGLGVLIFAKHPALRSIALISITGILSVVLIAQVLIPFLFHALIGNRIKNQHFPWTATGWFKSVFSLGYFASGSLIMTVIGFILIRINPFNREKGKYIFHYILSKYTWSVLYIMGNVKKTVVNKSKETFQKPAVLIANHQGFLDILATTMLYPKLILLTNKWVWRSPVFGAVVRMADYYPVADGIENSIELLAGRVKEGYSIVVFPEGTRSRDGRLRRFHKGAFYLAEKLKLDMVPVLIHGTGYTMTKGDFLLKDGRIKIEILPRIPATDDTFGTNYTERSKQISRNFKAAFNELSAAEEQPVYFRELLYYNYVYKGPVLEWYMRIKVKLENNYQVFHDLLPKTGRIFDIGCGYGFMSYMLYFAARQRDITGIDYDEEKIAVASHCFSKTETINFKSADATVTAVENADGIILSDVLHYLEPAQQELLIGRCMDGLNQGGILLIRDGDRDLKERHRGTRLTEFFSTRFSGFNKTGGKGLFFLSRKTVEAIAIQKKLSWRIIDEGALTSNILFVITKEADHAI